MRRCARAYGVYSSPADVESCTHSVRAAADAGTRQRASELPMRSAGTTNVSAVVKLAAGGGVVGTGWRRGVKRQSRLVWSLPPIWRA